MRPSSAVIALGSNVSARHHIQLALTCLRKEFTVLRGAPVYETDPVGPPGQPPFLNTAVLVATDLDLRHVRRRLRRIEVLLGRQRTKDMYAPRTIDLDVIWRDGNIVDLDVESRHFLQVLLRDLGVAPGSPELGAPGKR